MTPSSVVDAAKDAEIRDLVERLVVLQADLEPFLALHTEDVIIVNVAGRRVSGKSALRSAMAGALQTPLAKVTTTSEIVAITHVSPSAALVSCLKTITDRREDSPPGSLPSTASLTYLVVAQDGTWRVALAQTTPVAN